MLASQESLAAFRRKSSFTTIVKLRLKEKTNHQLALSDSLI